MLGTHYLRIRNQKEDVIMRDTELQLIGKDKKHAYFNVYVHDKYDCSVKIELAKMSTVRPEYLSRFKQTKRTEQ